MQNQSLTERAEDARAKLLASVRETKFESLVLDALALTIAEGWDAGFGQGFDLGLGLKVAGNEGA